MYSNQSKVEQLRWWKYHFKLWGRGNNMFQMTPSLYRKKCIPILQFYQSETSSTAEALLSFWLYCMCLRCFYFSIAIQYNMKCKLEVLLASSIALIRSQRGQGARQILGRPTSSRVSEWVSEWVSEGEDGGGGEQKKEKSVSIRCNCSDNNSTVSYNI